MFLAALYGLLGFVICAALGAAGWLFWRHTRAGALISRVRATLAARREADPLVAITMTAHVLAVLAALGIAWGISRKVALTFQLRFHNQGLIAAYIATVAIGAVVGALIQPGHRPPARGAAACGGARAATPAAGVAVGGAGAGGLGRGGHRHRRHHR